MNKIINKKKILIIYIAIVILFLLLAGYYNLDIEKFLVLLEKNKNDIIGIDNEIFFKITVFFILFSIIWTFFLGIGIPLFLFVSFFYDVFLGTFILVSSRTVGSTLMYTIFKNYFSKDIKNYLNKKKIINTKLMNLINRNKFKFFFSIRLIPGIPYQIPDLLPILFNMSIISFFLSKFLGSLISNFVIINMFSNIYQKLNIKFYDNSINQDLSLLISIIIFLLFFMVGINFKKKYFKN